MDVWQIFGRFEDEFALFFAGFCEVHKTHLHTKTVDTEKPQRRPAII